MKVLKNILIGLLVLVLLAVAGLFIFLKTFNINAYLPQITRQIGQIINRKVTIGHADLDLGLDGVSLDLKNITVSDDPQFSRNNFLELQEAQARLDVMAALLKRQINVTKIVLASPRISVIRLPDGRLNVQTMAPAAPAQEAKPAGGAKAAASHVASDQAMALPAVTIGSIAVSHAQLVFEDQNPQMPLSIVIPDVEIAVNHFSLSAPFTFIVSANAWGRKQNNISVSGQCHLDLAASAAEMSGLQIKSDLSQWDWNKVREISPVLGKLPVWPQEIRGDVTVDIPKLNASPKGLQGLSLQISLNEGYVKLKELLNPLEHITLRAESDLNDLSVKQLQVQVKQGTINLKGDVHGLMSTPTYTFQLDTKSVKVQDLIDQSKAPAVVEGEVDAQFTGSGESFDPQAMLQNFKGDGQFSLNNGKIEKLNILKTILGKLDFIPGLGDILQNALEGAMPSNIKDELDTDTTVLDKAEGKVKIANKVITVSEGQVSSKLFAIEMQGTVDFDLNTSMDIKTYLGQDISAALTHAAPPLQGLLDDQGRIYIPGKVSGKVPSVKYLPQAGYVTKKAAIAEGAQQLQKVIGNNPAIGNLLNSFLGGSSQ
ncbi:MAG: AsmA family protein [Candidatus Omnitrophica bacterium]|nr:AsmA family protein [Candidatus Omnitrophota bacterium]